MSSAVANASDIFLCLRCLANLLRNFVVFGEKMLEK